MDSYVILASGRGFVPILVWVMLVIAAMLWVVRGLLRDDADPGVIGVAVVAFLVGIVLTLVLFLTPFGPWYVAETAYEEGDRSGLIVSVVHGLSIAAVVAGTLAALYCLAGSDSAAFRVRLGRVLVPFFGVLLGWSYVSVLMVELF